MSFECVPDKPAQVKSLMETAKIFGVTIDDAMFEKILERVYDSNAKTILDETTTKTRTESNILV